MDNEYIVLHSPFHIDTHKKTFVNYLEVVIGPDGTVEYAVPSHQEKLIRVIAKQRNIDRDEVPKMCPVEMYWAYMAWLCRESGYIAVWNDHVEGKPNKDQSVMLQRLAANGLYHGNVAGNKRTWYCVVSSFDNNGRAIANLINSIESEEKPESTYHEGRRYDVYTDWFDSLDKAKMYQQDIMRA